MGEQARWVNGRIATVIEELEGRGLDALLLTHLPNIRYLFNFTGSTALALVTASDCYLIVDSRYWTQAEQEASGCRILRSSRANQDKVLQLVKRMKVRRLGFESARTPYSLYRHLRDHLASSTSLIPCDGLVEKARMVKDQGEIDKIRRALELTWRAFDAIIPLIKVGVREKDLATELEYKLLKSGAAKLSFDTIIASGVRSAMPHGRASDKRIGKNEFVVFDFGIYLDGYASDMTRTVFIGKPDSKAKSIYNAVRQAMERAIEEVRPGVRANRIDKAARRHITDRGYGQHFGHGTGHGIGLEVHEQPFINRRQKIEVTPGMVFTIEPGIYVPDFGGVRIEDIVAVTERGCEVLTKYPRDMIIL